MKFKLKEDIEYILSKLEDNGYEGYIVGGSVRDLLLGLSPKDYDICTNASPSEIIPIFKNHNIIETGLKHGTITLILNSSSYEITTFRTEGEYLDNRRPSQVNFISSLKEDLTRRDFTINSMAYNYKKGLVDYFNGQEDLKNKIIKCVGEPKKRFSEDALRIIRCLRFASVYTFKIEENTSESLKTCKNLLQNISAERINIELCKTVLGDNAEYIFMNYLDIFEVIIPELRPMLGFKQHNPHHKYDVYTHTIKAMVATSNIIQKITMLLHDIGKPRTFTIDENGIGHFYGHGKISKDIADDILTKLKFSNTDKNMILTLIENHDIRIMPEKKVILRWLNKLGEETFENLLIIQKGDILAQNDIFLAEKLKTHKKISTIYQEIKKERLCFSLKDLNINGNDLINLGFSGKKIGEVLSNILEMVIDDKIQNIKEELLKVAKEMV